MPITGRAYVPSVAPGVYQATVTDCREKAATKDPTNIFRVWEFTLRDGSGRTVGASSSLSTTAKSKGGKWIAALRGGRALEVGETFEPIGQPCTIVVALNDDGYEFVETVAAPEGAVPVSPVRPMHEGMEQDEKPATKGTPDDLPF